MASPSCPSCTSADLLVVKLAPKGTPMLFHTCRRCENRWWTDINAHEDVPMDLHAVIGAISV